MERGQVVSEIKRAAPVEERMREALKHPLAIVRELNNRSFYHFLQYFWPVVVSQSFVANWHIEYLCKELEEVAKRVGNRLPKEHDLIINVPPGSSKTLTVSIMFPAWCWTQWPWMRFITASYSGALSLESAEYCREVLRSTKFQQVYPDIQIKEDKDTKSNFRIVKKSIGINGKIEESIGGGRYSTSVGGTLTGFHADILVVDDPLNPKQATSDIELNTANHWMEQTLHTRKTEKSISTEILVMQRLSQNDPSGHKLEMPDVKIKHICIPGEITTFREQVKPPELVLNYKDGLLDPVRLPWTTLKELEAVLGQYGYAGQIGQIPTPPGGGMFHVEEIEVVEHLPPWQNIIHTVRYWDKAATKGAGDYTVGVKMSSLVGGKWIITDMKRGQWGSNERENMIRQTAENDGLGTVVWLEQEAGSGGKESSESTIRNLAGYVVRSERPTGDKTTRADPFSVQVNAHNIMMIKGSWNYDLISELRYFPFGKHDDCVDSASGCFSKLVERKIARRIT